MNDPVDHPAHYNQHPSGVECIQIARHMNFNLGNAMKYVWRAAEGESGIEDLRKAAWCIADEIRRRTPPAAPGADQWIPGVGTVVSGQGKP